MAGISPDVVSGRANGLRFSSTFPTLNLCTTGKMKIFSEIMKLSVLSADPSLLRKKKVYFEEKIYFFILSFYS